MYELDLIWGWQPALYLFLGGLGAGTFLIAAILLLKGGAKYRRLVSAASFAAFACVAVGLLLLLAELIKPMQGLLVWQSFSHFTSWMTYGAWIAMGAMLCFAVTGVLCAPWFGKAKAAKADGGSAADAPVPGAAKVFAIIGALFSLALAFYTGMLLMCAEGVAFWHTGLLPALFTISAIDTGIALVELIALGMEKRCPLSANAETALRTGVICLVALEAVVLGIFLASALTGTGSFGSYAATAAASAAVVVGGSMASWFWAGVVACGLACPLVMALALLRKHGANPACAAFGPVCALIGGCILRFVVLFAGIHVDLVGAAVTLL